MYNNVHTILYMYVPILNEMFSFGSRHLFEYILQYYLIYTILLVIDIECILKMSIEEQFMFNIRRDMFEILASRESLLFHLIDFCNFFYFI